MTEVEAAVGGTDSPADALKTKLQRWLMSQGYPLELRTAQAFRGIGNVRQSDYYYDSESACHREIDVVVSMRANTNSHMEWLDVLLCIEAKSGADKPWVLFCGERVPPLHPLAQVAERFTSPAARAWIAAAANSHEVRALPLLTIEEHPGHNLIKATLGPNQGQDVAYKAIISAVKAAHWEATRKDIYPKHSEVSIVAFPVIVIDAPLFKCDIDESGELRLRQVDMGTLIWHNNIVPSAPPHTIVHVVTEAGIPEYARQASETTSGLSKSYERIQRWKMTSQRSSE
ncbi:hypothetical protein ONA70_30315 [Micromonospora yasonensis]|uniref:hypothetical protein n=1 Tax=Micromonospora yasonensis TaxID=1128667 RepID=UPI002231D79C|nr:hypothetical protein [Micromonospora yasonensis]MCW3844391.1 hypothetical protein [Micromonospora yasonensis]